LMFGRAYRCRSPENVVAELEAKRPRSVFFYDDNFAANKKRLKTLLRLMIERGLTMPWLAQVRTDVARDEELLTLMRQSGCRRLALGFESVDQATLDGYAKSQTVEDIVHAIDALHSHGIKVHGMFVVGADNDTVQTARDTITFAEKHGLDTLMLNVLTPGLGTKQFEMMDAGNRIFETRWQFYDGQHVIYVPQQMTPLELQTEIVEGYRHFYSLRRGLGLLVRLRFADLLPHVWGWSFSRRWRRDPANQAYVRELADGSWRAALAAQTFYRAAGARGPAAR
jgi:radical SAM superfamily enzyme YgiQ (UPF0313 family)